MMIKEVDGCLMDDDRVIAEFVPEVMSVREECGDLFQIWVTIRLVSGDTRKELDPIRFKEINSLRFEDIHPLFMCPDQQAEKTVQRYIKEEVNKKIRAGDIGIIFVQKGWNRLPDGRMVNVTGKDVLGELNNIDYAVEPELCKVQMVNVHQETKTLLRNFWDVVRQVPKILLLLVLYAVRSLLITPFAEAGYPLRFVLFLTGSQGLGKTTSAIKFALPFDYHDEITAPSGIIDAGSTPAALRRTFKEMRDEPAILDDIAKTSDPKEDWRRRDTASLILRFVANDTPLLRSVGRKVERQYAHCGLTVTSEQEFQSASDITRMVIVAMLDQMKDFSVDDRALSSSVYYRFLEDFAKNYARRVMQIKTWLKEKELPEDSPRQQQHYAELELCLELMLDFSVREGALLPDECQELRVLAQKSFDDAYSQNCDLIRKLDRKALRHPGKLILEAIGHGKVKVATKSSKFEKNLSEYDGFKDGNELYIRLESIAQIFGQAAERRVTTIEAGKILHAQGLVAENGEHRTAGYRKQGLPRLVRLDRNTLEKT